MELDGLQYKMIVENSPNLLWRAGTDGLCDYFNATWLHFRGRTMEQEEGTGWAEGVHPEDLDRCLATYMSAFEKREPFEMVYRLKRNDGEWRWINDRGVPYFDEGKMFLGYIGSCMDVTERVIGEQLREMAQKDGLTGVNNRQYFEQLAGREMEKAKRYKNSLCLSMVDIDNFKTINDVSGHLAGDRVLQDFAGILESNMREFDILGRYGGDEFVILLPNTGEAEAHIMLDRIQNTLKRSGILDGEGPVEVTFCCGIAEMRGDDTLESLENRADEKMYCMKKSRK